MSSKPTVVTQVRTALSTAAHSIDYARHLVQGNRVPGDIGWMREQTRPVVLVHGFLGTRGTMLPLTRRLQADGRVVFSYSYGTFQTASLRASAQGLVGHVRRISEQLGAEKVDVVGFSMGGLMAVHALKFLQAHEWIERLVALGSPFAGTPVGWAGVATLGPISPSVWQVLPRSSFLDDLARAPLPRSVRVRQIHGAHDLLCPAPGPIVGVDPRDYIVVPGGHSSLVVAPHVYDLIREFLDGERAEPTAAGDASAVGQASAAPGEIRPTGT